MLKNKNDEIKLQFKSKKPVHSVVQITSLIRQMLLGERTEYIKIILVS